MTLRLGIIGAEGHIDLVAGELPTRGDVRLVAYAPSYAGEDVSRYRGLGANSPTAYTNASLLLERADLDLVAICGRYDRYAPLAMQALQRGIHVLSEKPAALDLDSLAALEETIASSRATYSLMLQMRFFPAFYTARQLMAQGLIGRALLISGQKSYRWGPSRPAFYAQPEHYGSTMAWVGIHAFDYAHWVAGIRYADVTAYHANLVHTERPACQDVATVMARLAGGGSATFTLDYLRPEAAPSHGDDRLRIVGETGILEICDEGTRLDVITSEEHVANWPLLEPPTSLFGAFMQRVTGASDSATAPLPTAQACIDVTRFALLAAQAADTGETLPL